MLILRKGLVGKLTQTHLLRITLLLGLHRRLLLLQRSLLVLRQRLILRLGSLLTHPKLREQRLTVEFSRPNGLAVLLRFRLVCGLLRCQRLLEVLLYGLVLGLCGLLTRLERRQLCLTTELTRRHTLQEVLLLCGVALLRGSHGLLEVLRLRLVRRLLGLLAHGELLAGQLCAEFGLSGGLPKLLGLRSALRFL